MRWGPPTPDAFCDGKLDALFTIDMWMHELRYSVCSFGLLEYHVSKRSFAFFLRIPCENSYHGKETRPLDEGYLYTILLFRTNLVVQLESVIFEKVREVSLSRCQFQKLRFGSVTMYSDCGMYGAWICSEMPSSNTAELIIIEIRVVLCTCIPRLDVFRQGCTHYAPMIILIAAINN